MAQTYNISGFMGTPHGGIFWSSAAGASGAVQSDDYGGYDIEGLINGTYTLIPQAAFFTFDPSSRTVIINGAGVAAMNFTATPIIIIPPALAPDTTQRNPTAPPASGQIIPLTVSPNQAFGVNLAIDGGAITLNMHLRFNAMAGYWVASIFDVNGNLLLDSLPLITGWFPAANLLSQFGYMRIGAAYILNEGVNSSDYPGVSDLGTGFQLLWGNTAS